MSQQPTTDDHAIAGDRVIQASGAVAWRPGPQAAEVLLVHRMKYDDWSLPKGKREPGEHMLANAVREVREETGARVVLGRRLRGNSYLVRGVPKEVGFWSARVARIEEGAVPNGEVDELAWLLAADAAELVTYPRDASVLSDFARYPANTVPLVLVRHASAGSKADWHGDDADRPLDAAGAADAKALAALLACFAPGAALDAPVPRVLSSATARCTGTVGPYAELAGARVAVDPAFSRTDRGRSAGARIRSVVADGVPAVICAHRENVPSLLGDACAALGGQMPSDPSLAKAGFWVLHHVAGKLAGAERYEV